MRFLFQASASSRAKCKMRRAADVSQQRRTLRTYCSVIRREDRYYADTVRHRSSRKPSRIFRCMSDSGLSCFTLNVPQVFSGKRILKSLLHRLGITWRAARQKLEATNPPKLRERTRNDALSCTLVHGGVKRGYDFKKLYQYGGPGCSPLRQQH